MDITERQAKRGPRFGLRGKTVAVMLLAGLVPLIAGLVLIALEGTARMREATGSQFEELAQEASRKTELAVQKEVAQLRYLAAVEVVQSALRDQNTTSVLEASRFLARFTSREDRGKKIHAIRLFNATGRRLLASQNPLPESPIQDRVSDHTVDILLGPVYLDKKTETYLVDIHYPITHPLTHKYLGSFLATYNLDLFLNPFFYDIQFGETGHAMLIDSEGTVLVCPILPTGSHVADPKLLTEITRNRPGWMVADQDGHGGHNSIVGFAPISIGGIKVATPWHSFIRQEPSETDAPIRSLLSKILFGGLSLIGLMASLVFVASNRLVRPIRLLKEGAQQIGAGALEHRLAIHTRDEIESLANAFNEMAGRLSESYSTLEHKVEDRTRALAALNQIGATVIQSLDLQALLQASLEKVIEVFRMETGVIHLIEEGDTLPILRATAGLDRGEPLDFSPIAQEVITRQNPLWIEDLRAKPLPPPLEVIRQRSDLGALVAIRIRSPQRVLGSLTLSSRIPWHRNAQQEELLLSMGNQIGTALENAMLYRNEKKLVEQLVEMDRMKNEFLSNISHELRMPLTAIIGFSELLLDHLKGGLSFQQQEYIQNILNNGKHLSELISTLLDLSKIRAGKMNVHPVFFSFNEMIAGLEKILKPTLLKKRQSFKVDVPPLPPFCSDPNKIKQILANLLGNASKFTPEEGSVGLQIHPSTFQKRPAIEIRVSDTGIGIPADAIEHIFQPFHQVDSSYTRDFPGSGLGLAIAKSLVELLEGTIDVESTIGKGSVFTVYLPSLEDSATLSDPEPVSRTLYDS